MVGKLQAWTRLHRWHVATLAGSRHGHPMLGLSVATDAHRLGGTAVRVMAGGAFQTPGTLQEAGAPGQIERLMADVPGVREVRVVACGNRLAMAGSASVIHRRRGQLAGVEDRAPAAIMPGTVTVAGLALDPGLWNSDLPVRGDGQFAG